MGNKCMALCRNLTLLYMQKFFFEIEILKKNVIVVIGMLLNMKEKCDLLRLKSKCDLYCWVQKTIFLNARSQISFFLQRTLVNLLV